MSLLVLLGCLTECVLPSTLMAQQATPASSITTLDGFQVELLHSATPDEGSWISMTFDDQGRIVIGRDSNGLARVTLPKDGEPIAVEIMPDESLRHCRGVLFANQSLYVSATDSKAIYRLRDTNGDDLFDQKQLLTEVEYNSRYGHGTNQIVLGPDKMIYLVNGNDITLPPIVSSDSPYRDPQPDQLVFNPHDAGQDNRVGHIIRMDGNGEHWQVIAGGLRNQFDLAFNEDGEMFTFDADMEWDVGLPWYRPTRLNHIVSAGEYGWRWGTGKWPEYYFDSLPSTLDLGLGSPTAVISGGESNFPSALRSALFLADWQNGRILYVHLIPKGATYECEYGLFVEGGPLNVCDIAFGPDGAMYFITGGRGSQTGLYRVTYVGGEKTAMQTPVVDPQQAAAENVARNMRHHLESFHSRQVAGAIEEIWPQLGGEDRWLRYAARVALERQPVSAWSQRALAETDIRAQLSALLALVHAGESQELPGILQALGRIDLKQLQRQDLLDALRVYQLALIRHGPADAQAVEALTSRLDAIYPHPSSHVNRELCELLVYLQAPTVIEKSLSLLHATTNQEDQIQFAHLLVRKRTGWTIESSRIMLAWLNKAREFKGGKLVPDVIQSITADFLELLDDTQRGELSPLIENLKKPLALTEQSSQREFVKKWQLEELLPIVSNARAHSFQQGKQATNDASCLKCHKIGEFGSNVGPDLTQIGKRLDARGILESILEPSKVIDPKYRHTGYELQNGKTIVGRPVGVAGATITVEVDPLSGEQVTIQRTDIESSFPAEQSPMPQGLIEVLRAEEIADLVFFLMAGGDERHAIYQSSNRKQE
jgi:putative heme-binding domain-containing protein